MYIACKLFILVLGLAAHSMLYIYACLIWRVADLCWHDTYHVYICCM